MTPEELLVKNGKVPGQLETDGPWGNAFMIMGALAGRMHVSGWSREDIEEYRAHMMSGDYENLCELARRAYED